ncbi:MAG: hypothetical protein DA407_08300 [Bacteroidetes bacterium]|nr:MAG: hypothetical protein DA407_08300 [Bacteroidota bacterium]
MRLLALFILAPFFLFSQVQIGNDIDGVAAGDQSGNVSISSNGNIVAIGGPNNDDAGEDAGHVRVFENIHGVWTQIGNAINGDAAGDHFGSSVSLSADGSILAIGAPLNDNAGTDSGNISVYENISGTWTQFGSVINGDAAGDNFGTNVSLSNNGLKIVIGSYYSARILENISGNWIQLGSDFYGYFFAFSGDGLTISVTYGYWDNFVFEWVNVMVVYRFVEGNWNQDFDSISSSSYIRSNLSDDGTIMAVTSVYGGYIFDITSPVSWTQIDNTIMSYGNNIEISSNCSIVAIGGSDTPEDQVQIFYNNDNNWTQIGSDIDGDNIGNSLSLSGDGSTIAIGAPFNDDNGTDAGQVRVYDLSALLSVEESSLLSVKLYPNPTTNRFTIELPLGQTLEKANIYNDIGQFIQTSQKNIIDTSKLSSGLYFVEVVTTQGKATKKLVIK